MKIDRHLSVAELAAVVCDTLRKAGIDAVLTGGSVVSIYTDNEYKSRDLDFITPASISRIEPVMSSIGFSRTSGRHFEHPESDLYVEFPSGALMVGNEHITKWDTMRVGSLQLAVLTPTQAVKDRLAAFYHWRDRQALDQAVKISLKQAVNRGDVESWSKAEGSSDLFGEYVAEVERKRK